VRQLMPDHVADALLRVDGRLALLVQHQ
jgi:hypothetical protein